MGSKSKLKSLWRERHPESWSFYCPYCKAERKLPYSPRPGLVRHYVQVGLTAVFFTLVAWPLFGWKGIVSALPFWAVFEVIYRGRVRAAISCQNCGFDPYLYLTDVKRARDEIEKRWRVRFEEKGIPFPEKQSAIPKNASLTETRPER
jgi:hypothetical protein